VEGEAAMIDGSPVAARELPSTGPRPVLEVADLSVTFRGIGGRRVRAVRGVTFQVRPRETLALVGESGSGKTVTAMSVLRLLDERSAEFEGGRIRVATPAGVVDMLGADPRTIRSVRGAIVAMIFQEPMTSLNPLMTVGEQVAEAITLHAADRALTREGIRAAMIDALARVGIREPEARLRDYPHQFSGGMRQRVMIAMALACRPSLLIADEPTTALDVTVQARILDLIREQAEQRDMAVLLVTHDLGIVADRADRVGVMYTGRIGEAGPVADVLRDPIHPYTRALLRCRPEVGRRRARLVTVADTIGDPRACRIEVNGQAMSMWMPKTQADQPLGDTPVEPRLQEVAPGRYLCVLPVEPEPGHDASPARRA